MTSWTIIRSTILFAGGLMMGALVALGVASLSVPRVGNTNFAEITLADSLYLTRLMPIKGKVLAPGNVAVDAMQLPHGCVLWVPTTGYRAHIDTTRVGFPSLPGADKPLD
jgi:hypothetical protein